jgi:GNAT superfamily N-acetyltransferase
MPEIALRPAFVEDYPSLVNLDHSYLSSYVWQMERLVHDGQITINFREIRLPRNVKVDYPRNASALSQQLSISNVLVALIEDKPVGYASVHEENSPRSAWVTDLVVAEKYRKKGIGSALFLGVQEWAVQKNIKRIILEMQLKNYPAIRFAQKFGLEFCGYHDHYYANQDIALFFAFSQR